MVVSWKRGDNMPIPTKSFIFPKFGIFYNIPGFFWGGESKIFWVFFVLFLGKMNTGTFQSLILFNKSGVF